MEVCIFGVLTVNLLTFSSSERSSPIRTPSPPMSVKGDWLSLGRKKLKCPATARFTGLYDGWQEA